MEDLKIQGNPGQNNSFSEVKVEGGSYNPAANVVNHNHYYGDSAIKIAQQTKGEDSGAQILDMTYFSGTFPEQAVDELWRDVQLSLCEEKLETNTVVCVTGEEGIGMTTFLSQFARRHSTNCVSYFYNSFDRIRLNSEVMERDITEQLYWFATKCPCPNDIKHISDVYSKVMKALRQTKCGVMYFVFDGFSNIPSELQENICKLISTLQWEKAHFLFSGKKEQIGVLFKQNKKWSIDEIPLIGWISKIIWIKSF